MSQLTVIAKLKAKSGAEERLYEECRKLIAPTLAEEGSMNYDMYRSTEDRSTFIFTRTGRAGRFGSGICNLHT